jgi:hypothetical protein
MQEIQQEWPHPKPEGHRQRHQKRSDEERLDTLVYKHVGDRETYFPAVVIRLPKRESGSLAGSA